MNRLQLQDLDNTLDELGKAIDSYRLNEMKDDLNAIMTRLHLIEALLKVTYFHLFIMEEVGPCCPSKAQELRYERLRREAEEL